MRAHVLPACFERLRGYSRLTAFPVDMMFCVLGVSNGYQIKQVQLKQWNGLKVLCGCLGYLVGCDVNEAREEESDFIVWRDASVFCLGLSIRHQPSPLYSGQGKCHWPRRTNDLRSCRGASKRSAGPTWFVQFLEFNCEQLVMFCGARRTS
ncbi:uncharacterized protein M421DRAFT_193301 [Didymella exigua CBS 183.55]|uniref:Uncharacterized protein n=1 Tax=Didymella exigua CBS 183.55 TaxID=1150837 RepID=A0A6A5S0A8_9PLEO|nr:uncharacterized protein M421DRAFT_193301 [Didymella exigua CBS 183.55]KAF1933283.1 hypothetical protein M421DRAFT_193301 [Didymella exigua CBS 183.55]